MDLIILSLELVPRVVGRCGEFPVLPTYCFSGWSWAVHGGVEFSADPDSHDDFYPPGADGRRRRETLDPGFAACFLR